MVGGIHAIYSAKGIGRRKKKRATGIDSCTEWCQAKNAFPLRHSIHCTLIERVVGMQSPAQKYMRVKYLRRRRENVRHKSPYRRRLGKPASNAAKSVIPHISLWLIKLWRTHSGVELPSTTVQILSIKAKKKKKNKRRRQFCVNNKRHGRNIIKCLRVVLT